ncbi:nitrilase-related carbon-nitrogen hydrolase [Amycolatopsis sp. 3B14]|uniref:nitrilase-related carbon-nitrogen hydrolase n=1 Tax=Amycolatopsis sp. 3B14 TaxID=3243600 RepID=UPI003D98D0C4
MTSLRIGLTQWHATRDVEHNLGVACRLVDECAADGADLVLLPENGLMLGTNTEMRAAAMRLDGPELARLGAAAAAARVPVVLGGAKLIGDDGIVRNTAVVFGPDGTVVGGYDKIHLFDANVGGQSFEASGVERAGDQPVLLRVGGVTVGLTICYDVRFPELFRALAAAGAEVLLVPAAFTAVTGAAHWETLLRARAIENAAYVVASATVAGSPDDAFPTYGHALAVGPWGEVLADLGTAPLACRVIGLDLATVVRTRAKLPVLRGVRPGAYARQPVTISANQGGES